MVADVIGKDYTRPTATATTTTPPVTAPSPWKGRDDGGPAGCKYSAEEAEQFLCSMLGDNFELGMGVVRDVLGESFFFSCRSSFLFRMLSIDHFVPLLHFKGVFGDVN
jgi:hypothetical protein